VNYGSDTESFDPLDLIGLLWQPLAKDRPLGRCSCRAIAPPCASFAQSDHDKKRVQFVKRLN